MRRSESIFPSLERLLRKLSLRAQVAILLAVAMLPIGVFAVAQGITNYAETKKLRREAFTFEAVQASQIEQAAILEAFGALNALDALIDVDGDADTCRGILNAFIEQEPTVPFIGFIDSEGMMECSHPPASPLDFSNQIGFQTFLKSPRRAVTAREKGEVSGQQVIVVNQPIYRDGALRGSLSMSISSRYLEWVARSKNLAPEARFAIVTADGSGVAQSTSATDFDWLPSATKLRAIFASPERIVEVSSRSGQTRVFAIAPLFKQDIFAISSWPGEIVPASLGWLNLLTVSLPILMWGLAVAVAYFAVDQLALRHILYLDRLVTAYGRSGRPLRAHRMRNAPTEIAKLGSSFDEMVEVIETREQDLVETVQEKDGLLREVNHRVKNNLQMISSLMSLQIRDAGSDREKLGLERLQERIQGLALVHQKIYESENTNAVRIDLLITEIAENLRNGSARKSDSVTLTTDLNPVTVIPDTAVPLILFATEAIVNTFKHALSHVDNGKLEIILQDDTDSLCLSIQNSKHPEAVSKDEKENAGRGIGQQLIDGFTRQLRGTVNRRQTSDSFYIELIVPKTEIARPAQ